MFKKSQPYYIKRLIWIRFLVVLILPLFAYRLFVVAILGHHSYAKQAQRQYFVSREVPSQRGEIFAQDREGGEFPLATNATKFQIWAIPKNIQNKPETAHLLAENLGLDEKEVLAKINNRRLYIPPLKKRVDEAAADKIKKLKLSGVLVVPESVRFYPEDELACHLLGFVNFDAQGAYGLEGYYNNQLIGYKGRVEAEKDNKGRFININSEVEARNGESLALTIDHNIQYFAQEEIKKAVEKYDAQSGQLMIMDPKTGALLAMAATPCFNPNNFNEEAEKDKQEGKDRFTNPMISYVYEPGSIIKPLVVAGGLENGKIQPDSVGGPFGSQVEVQGYEIHTAQNKAFGRETITQILQHSDNVGMVWVGQQIGKELMYQNFKKFYFGKNLGIDLSGETHGFLLPLKRWREIHQATMTFGQGISTTPLQILTAYAAIANQGKMMQPHVVDKIIQPNGKENKIEPKMLSQPIKKETAGLVKQMLKSVVEEGYGKKARVDGYTLAGKTGTAQIPKSGGGYEEDKVIHSFVGFGPVEDPRFVILVKLDQPTAVRFAASSAAPIFKETAQFLFNYLEIPRSNE